MVLTLKELLEKELVGKTFHREGDPDYIKISGIYLEGPKKIFVDYKVFSKATNQEMWGIREVFLQERPLEQFVLYNSQEQRQPKCTGNKEDGDKIDLFKTFE